MVNEINIGDALNALSMPAPIRVMLSEQEDCTLKELSYARGVRHRTKQRALAIRLNARGWNTPQIAQFFDWHEHSVRNTLERWKMLGLGWLCDQKGRERKHSRT